MPFVLDNSVVVGWIVENQASPYHDAMAERLRNDRALAPALWPLELANVLRRACLRGATTLQAAQAVAERIATLPIDIDRKPVTSSELLALALRFGITSYGAAYLELALRQGLPIATVDAELRAAATASGVGIAREAP